MGANIPNCWICQKLAAVLNVAIVGGPIVEVCDECLKYDEKIEFCEIDNLMNHTDLIDVVNIKRKIKQKK